MAADSGWWVALIPEDKGVAGRAGSTIFQGTPSLPSLTSLTGNQPEPRSIC